MAQTTVSFNDEDKAYFDALQSSKSFSQFVKQAFYDKLDEARSKYSCDPATIERICQDQIMKLTKGQL